MAAMEDLKVIISECLLLLTESTADCTASDYKLKYDQLTYQLKTKKVTLFNVVEALGPDLTNIDAKRRAASTCLIADVLGSSEKDSLIPDEINHFSAFLCDRLKDHPAVVPHALQGLLSLTCNNSTLPNGCGSLIVSTVFREVHNQSQMQATRRTVYTLFAELLSRCLQEIKDMNEDFVLGFIQAMDGEKDPRNLLIVFNTIPFIAKNFNVTVLAEELFEVTSCYFPIEFSPPPNSPGGITKRDLVVGLRECLASTPTFAQFCLPLLLEKLDADILDSKIDAFETLTACCPVYGIGNIRPFFSALWKSIRTEVFTSRSEALEKSALESLTAILKTASSDIDSVTTSGVVEELIDEILKDCQQYLHEPEMKLMFSTAHILMAAAMASSESMQQVGSKIFPLLLQEFVVHSHSTKRKNVLDVLNIFIKLCGEKELGSSHDFVAPIVPVYMLLLTDENTELTKSSLYGFEHMLKISNLLSADDTARLCQHLAHLINFFPKEEVVYTALQCTTVLAHQHPHLSCEKLLPTCFSSIENSASIEVQSGDAPSLHSLRGFKLACALSVEHTLREKIISHIVVNLDNSKNGNSGFVSSSIACLNDIVTTTPVSESFTGTIIVPLFELVSKEFISSIENALSELSNVQAMGSLFGNVVKSTSASKAEALLKTTLPVAINSVQLDGFTTGATSTHKFILLLEPMLCSLPKSTNIPFIDELLNCLLKSALDCPVTLVANSSMKTLAALYNKLPDDILREKVEQIQQNLLNRMAHPELPETCNAVTLWSWITKALLLRGHPRTSDFILKLLDLFVDDTLNKAASKGFNIVAVDMPQCLSVDTHATIRMMYRQRLFLLTVDKLIEGFSSSQDVELRSHFLAAIVHQLQHLPLQVLSDHLPRLLPLLVQALTLENDGLQLSTLTTITALMQNSPGLVTNHVSTLVPYLLELCQKNRSMKVRMGALDCLMGTTNQPTHLLLPLKKTVIRTLGQCLDDKKRLVRQRAVAARCEWYLIGSPGGKTEI